MSLIIGSMYVVPVFAETEETVSEIDVTSEKSEDNSENLYDSVDEIAGGIVVSGKEAFLNAAAFFRNNKYLCNLILSLGELFRKIKKCSSIVLLFSIMAAVFVAVCARKNKKLRRYGLVLFLIVIPLLIFVFVYGIGTLYSFVITDNGIDAGAVENEVYQSALVLCKDIRFGNMLLKHITDLVPVLIVISEFVGCEKIKLGKYNPHSKRIGLYGFCIAIPAMLLILDIGIPIFSKMFV